MAVSEWWLYIPKYKNIKGIYIKKNMYIFTQNTTPDVFISNLIILWLSNSIVVKNVYVLCVQPSTTLSRITTSEGKLTGST